MSTTSEAVLQALRTAILSISGAITVWIAQSDSIRNHTDYIAILQTDDDTLEGYPSTSESAGTATITEYITASYMITAIGDLASPILRALRSALRSNTALRVSLKDAGATPKNIGQIRNMSAHYKTGIEPRHVLSLSLGYCRDTVLPGGSQDAAGIVVDLETKGALIASIPNALTVP